MDIEKWLCGLGLQQYVATFRDNAIDAEVLSELTEADLEKLGVVLGHRKRLLKAIATLASQSACERLGPDPRRAFGPAATHLPHQQVGRETAPDQCCTNVGIHRQGTVPTRDP